MTAHFSGFAFGLGEEPESLTVTEPLGLLVDHFL